MGERHDRLELQQIKLNEIVENDFGRVAVILEAGYR